MTTVVTISDAAKARADELIRSGRCTSFDEVIHAAIRQVEDGWIDEEVNLDDLSPEVRAAVDEGLAEIAAGQGRDAEEVFAELSERYRNWQN